MDAIMIVDMQVGLLNGAPKYDLAGIVDRINLLTDMVRGRAGRVLWIQHCGADDDFALHAPGWELLPALCRHPADFVVSKTLNDPFAGTELRATLQKLAPTRVLVTGWATDFCVDATVRSAVSNGHRVVVVSDAHTLSDRPHLDAPAVIRHHNWVWSNLIATPPVRLATTAELLDEDASAGASAQS